MLVSLCKLQFKWMTILEIYEIFTWYKWNLNFPHVFQKQCLSYCAPPCCNPAPTATGQAQSSPLHPRVQYSDGAITVPLHLVLTTSLNFHKSWIIQDGGIGWPVFQVGFAKMCDNATQFVQHSFNPTNDQRKCRLLKNCHRINPFVTFLCLSFSNCQAQQQILELS